MAVPSEKVAHIPADIVYDSAESILNALHVYRGDGDASDQNDHSLAFVLLKELLCKQISLSDQKDRLHITPVFEALYNIADKELVIYTCFIVDQKVLEGLQNIKISLKKPKGKVTEKKDTSELKPEIQKDLVEELKSLIDEIAKKILRMSPGERDQDLLKNFFILWGKVIPYINLTELRTDLFDQIKKAKSFRKKIEQNARNDIKGILAAESADNKTENKEQFEKFERIAFKSYMLGVYKYAYINGMLSAFADTFAKYLNKLPFATFSKVKGISGKNRSSGVYVSQSIHRLRIEKFENLTEEEKKKIVDDMLTLLDFYRIGKEKVEEMNAEMMAAFSKKGGILKNKAIYSLLNRNDEPIVFAHVVTRHLRFISLAFPEFNRSKSKDELTGIFIQSMFDRWEINTEDEKRTHMEFIDKIISVETGVSSYSVSPETQNFLSPDIPFMLHVSSDSSSSVQPLTFSPTAMTSSSEPNLVALAGSSSKKTDTVVIKKTL